MGHLFWSSVYGFRSSRSTADVLTVVSDRIAMTFNWFGATWVVTLDISQSFSRVWLFGYLALFCVFTVMDDFGWFWMGILCKIIHSMLELLKALFLALHFSSYALVIFMMLYVILLSILIILLSTLNVKRHLICGNN